MRKLRSALPFVLVLAASSSCKSRGDGLTENQRTKVLASALATPAPAPPRAAVDSIGHPANLLPGTGPKRVESQAPRMGPRLPMLAGQGIGPIRIGANSKTIERLMGAPCDDATASLCRYVNRAVEFRLEEGVTKEIKISRKGRAAKAGPDGSILEFGFFNGAIPPDLYFGMQPGALQEVLGAPQKIDKVTPMGEDGFSERHLYDGMTLEYDAWSNGKLVLGAVIITKSDTAAAANEKAEQERAVRAAELAKLKPKTKTPPTKDPR